MKKFFLFAAMAVFAVTANAQIVSSSSVHSESNNYWYVRAGIGINGVSNVDDSKSKVGYDVEIGHAWMLGTQGAHLDLGLGLASRGYKLESSEEESNTKITKKLTAHNLYLAPTFGWKIPVASNITIDPHVGYYLGYDLGGKEKYDISGEYADEVKDYLEDEGYDLDGTSLGDLDGYKRFDTGFKFGAGVWIKNFNIDFAYKLGLTKMWDAEEKAPKSHSFEITVAYAF